MNRPKASAVTMWAAILITAAVVIALLVSFARLSDDNQTLHAAVAASQVQRQSLVTQANALEAQVKSLGERPVTNVRPIDPFPGPQGEPGLSIIGPMGPAGIGVDGADGRDGKRGSRGKTGAQGTSTTGSQGAQGDTGAPGESITGAQGEPGVDGKDGAAGEPGRDGRDGRGVESVTCEGPPMTFIFHYSDGTEQSVTCEPAPVEEPAP